MKVKFLAKVLGKMISSSPALGKIPMIFARMGYFALDQAVESNGWSSWVTISDELVNSFSQFLLHINLYNGHPILHSANSISLLSLVGPPEEFFSNFFLPLHIPELPTNIFVSDASNIAVCSYSIKSDYPFFFIGQLSQTEITVSNV